MVRRVASRIVSALLIITAVVVLLAGVAVVVGTRVYGYRVVTVETGSMEPTIHVGSVVVGRPVPGSTLRQGDVITFLPPARGFVVTHRVYSIKGNSVRTKGDANGSIDPWDLSRKSAFIKLQTVVPYAGTLVKLLRLPHARMWILVAAALLVGAAAIIKVWRVPPQPAAAPA